MADRSELKSGPCLTGVTLPSAGRARRHFSHGPRPTAGEPDERRRFRVCDPTNAGWRRAAIPTDSGRFSPGTLRKATKKVPPGMVIREGQVRHPDGGCLGTGDACSWAQLPLLRSILFWDLVWLTTMCRGHRFTHRLAVWQKLGTFCELRCLKRERDACLPGGYVAVATQFAESTGGRSGSKETVEFVEGVLWDINLQSL